MRSQAWGFSVGDAVVWRGPAGEVRAKVVQVTQVGSLRIRLKDSGGTRVVHNPKLLRAWEPPRTLDEIEAFLEGDDDGG